MWKTTSMKIYLSPGFGTYLILGLALRRVDGCLFFGFTDNLCFAAELSSNCIISPTFKSGSVIFVLFVVLCIVVSVKASHKTVKILTLEIIKHLYNNSNSFIIIIQNFEPFCFCKTLL